MSRTYTDYGKMQKVLVEELMATKEKEDKRTPESVDSKYRAGAYTVSASLTDRSLKPKE